MILSEMPQKLDGVDGLLFCYHYQVTNFGYEMTIQCKHEPCVAQVALTVCLGKYVKVSNIRLHEAI